MTNDEFEVRMKHILKKADLNLLCSGDPDIVSDIGCGPNGCLVIMGETFPLKIKDITNIRYRPGQNKIGRFIRLDFDKDVYLECHYDNINFGREFSARYQNTYKIMEALQETIAFFERVIDCQ